MMRSGLRVLVAVAALQAAGCVERPVVQIAPTMPPAPPRPPLVRPDPQRPPGDDPSAATLSPVDFHVLCDVLIAEAPGGVLSADQELWGHLREDSLGVQQSDHLARNGFRVGVGRSADFASVTRMILQAREAQVRQGRLQFQAEGAMDVVLNPEIRRQRAFVYAPDGSVSGDEYPAGVTICWVQAWHDIQNIDSVKLSLTPEIRHGRVRERYYSPGAQRMEQYRDVGRLFDEVKITLHQDRGQFVVVAPNLKADPALLVGRALLSRVDRGQTLETVLLVRPRVVRMPGR